MEQDNYVLFGVAISFGFSSIVVALIFAIRFDGPASDPSKENTAPKTDHRDYKNFLDCL
uniref:Uncharacterized protein n=1 Tax=Candidatus Kentrum sp. FM TaxID=2126340 RepID=A0A450W3C0_9GAMM|nr:MAG: hypothetical protein BECKFM1743A_GA0114220_101757 [Candidatus Kentron sp. FM]VFJ56875.1 MAG: hypothetical protein BECKFM1743C_GA0114222_101871 [Candidatus Kentron sp. FM]VFK11492.1 MAG: hypothetical protein BECKFM1743B_GA0114221_101861 [Candidatus Kentron sp. FM]